MALSMVRTTQTAIRMTIRNDELEATLEMVLKQVRMLQKEVALQAQHIVDLEENLDGIKRSLKDLTEP